MARIQKQTLALVAARAFHNLLGAAPHNKLVGEQLEAEWTIHSLKSDLKVRDARIKKLLAASEPGPAVVRTDVWSLEEARYQ